MPGIQSRLPLIGRRNDPRIRSLFQLRHRDARDRTGTALVDGIRFVAQAVEQRVPIRTLIAAPELLTNPFGRKLWDRLRRTVPCGLTVTADVFRALSLAEEPQGLAAVVAQRWEPLSRARPADGLCWVAVSSIQSPGNLGTILRTCDAVGAAGLIVIGDGPDPYDPACVRATMGALFSQRLVRTRWDELAAWKRFHGAALVGTSPGAASDYHAVTYPERLVLLMGYERRGLSAEEQAQCDLLVRIPMVGASDSLNLAIAAGVMLYEIYNQRRRPGP
jgi:TrmH family RNA methyltransferase